MLLNEDRRIKLTRKMLKDALIDLLERKDIYHISIRELCEAADVNRTTFYKYYGSQFELLADMENDTLALIGEALTKYPDRRELVIEDACRYLDANLKLARLLVNNNVDPAFPEKLFSMTALKDAVKNGSGREFTLEFGEYLYGYMTYGAYQVIRTWLNKDEREKPEDIARILIGIIESNF